MKKLVAVLIIISSVILLCSCSADTSGYRTELTSQKWVSEAEGGATAQLSFNNDIAELVMNSGNLQRRISGKYILDDKTLVIFVPEISYNYKFGYSTSCNTMELDYNGKKIKFEIDENK